MPLNPLSKFWNTETIGSIVIGNLVLALGTGLFIIPNNVVTGGVAGIAVILHPFLPISPTVTVTLLNIGLFILGSLAFGKYFAIKTATSTFLYPGFLAIISTIIGTRVIVQNQIVASLFGGILTGVGVGLVFRVNGSTGGVDVISLVIRKFTGLPLPRLVMTIDLITISLGFLSYGVENTLVGVISVYAGAWMIDKTILLGAVDAQQVIIVSREFERINAALVTNLGRGTTIYAGTGGYSKSNREVIMIVIARRQYMQLKSIVQTIDEHAFFLVADVKEVNGLGFSFQDD